MGRPRGVPGGVPALPGRLRPDGQRGRQRGGRRGAPGGASWVICIFLFIFFWLRVAVRGSGARGRASVGRPRLGRWVRGRRREQEEAEGGSARPGPGGSCQGGTGGGLRSSEGLGPRGGSPADSWGRVGFGLWRPFSPWVDGDAVAGRDPGTSGAPQVSPCLQRRCGGCTRETPQVWRQT